MRVKTFNGATELRFEDLAEHEPALIPIRDAFREGKIDADKVLTMVRPLVGMARFHRDFDRLFEASEYAHGTRYPSGCVQSFEEWLAKQPKGYSKLYYSHETVVGCITQEEKEEKS